MAAVAELTARAYGAPIDSANSRSNRCVFGPVVSQPERKVSTTSSISACVICGTANGRKVVREALFCSFDPTISILLSSMAKYYLTYCSHNDFHIKNARSIFDIVQIIL